ncbi:thioesterase [Luteimonas sp. SJ-92]|uniref:Thioesterase n=1 Tax=Luteimonas salinisoli TaxID=2752307 RepID=A0A853JDB3_9GAMM|nr:thioesterase [Luteimonas salinisoli]NZA26558.1 thioesterase [Luteimonas salinisoli]
MRDPVAAPADAARLTEGKTYELDYRVVAADSPRNLRLEDDDQFPDVLGTARMIGLMELAAARLMRPLLGEDEVSVGVGVDVKHLAATPLFAKVRIRATCLGRDGRLYRFKVELLDAGGVAGEGVHARAIVSAGRLHEGARRRVRTCGAVAADRREDGTGQASREPR